MRNCSQRESAVDGAHVDHAFHVRKSGTRLALTARIKLEMEMWGKVVRDANLTTE